MGEGGKGAGKEIAWVPLDPIAFLREVQKIPQRNRGKFFTDFSIDLATGNREGNPLAAMLLAAADERMENARKKGEKMAEARWAGHEKKSRRGRRDVDAQALHMQCTSNAGAMHDNMLERCQEEKEENRVLRTPKLQGIENTPTVRTGARGGGASGYEEPVSFSVEEAQGIWAAVDAYEQLLNVPDEELPAFIAAANGDVGDNAGLAMGLVRKMCRLFSPQAVRELFYSMLREHDSGEVVQHPGRAWSAKCKGWLEAHGVQAPT